LHFGGWIGHGRVCRRRVFGFAHAGGHVALRRHRGRVFWRFSSRYDFVAGLFAKQIEAFDHWVAFALLLILGAKMIFEGIKKDKVEKKEPSLHPKTMLPYAIATSVDALAVGLSFAFLRVSIAPAVAIIGAVTFALSMLGVKLGHKIGMKFKAGAEIFGGLVLIAIGVKIVMEHFGVF